MEKKRIAIIGAGIIGLMNAYYLQQEGYEVTVFDQRSESNTNFCSYGNAGLVVPSHIIPLAAPGMTWKAMGWLLKKDSPLGLKWNSYSLWNWLIRFQKYATKAHIKKHEEILFKMNQMSLEEYREMSTQLGFSFEQKGLQMVCESLGMMDEEQRLADQGAPYGLLSTRFDGEGLNQYHQNRLKAIGAVRFDNDAGMNPMQLIAHLKLNLLSKGVIIKYEQPISLNVKFDELKSQFEEGVGESFDQIIVCPGAAAKTIFDHNGLKGVMTAGKGFSFLIPKVQLVKSAMILAKEKVAITPSPEGTRVTGAMILGDYTNEIPEKKINQLRGIIQKVFGLSELPEAVNQWTGQRPCSCDGIPIIDYVDQDQKVMISTGHGMMGISLAPFSAQHILALMNENKKNNYAEILSVKRFL